MYETFSNTVWFHWRFQDKSQAYSQIRCWTILRSAKKMQYSSQAKNQGRVGENGKMWSYSTSYWTHRLVFIPNIREENRWFVENLYRPIWLNQALKRCPTKVPTPEELSPTFAQAKFFSKLDAKAGYWSVHLDELRQLLTTFRTPFWRYCWMRLPFGLTVSQDIFHSRWQKFWNVFQVSWE